MYRGLIMYDLALNYEHFNGSETFTHEKVFQRQGTPEKTKNQEQQ